MVDVRAVEVPTGCP